MQDRNNINQKILQYAIIFLPPALISGPFLPDLIVVISGIYFIAFLWKSNQIHFIKNDLSKILLNKNDNNLENEIRELKNRIVILESNEQFHSMVQ